MLASVGKEVPDGAGWSFEPKYDGIRVLAYVTERAVELLSRNGNSKTAQFPEVVAALAKLAPRRRPFVLDGEIVALQKRRGRSVPGRFQQLQSRMQLGDAALVEIRSREAPVAYYVFDLLMSGGTPLVDQPQARRRRELLKLFVGRTRADPSSIQVSDAVVGDATAMLRRARTSGWEGIIAKRVDAPYQSGKRSRDWLKLKLEQQQELVVGGFTEPRNSRQHLGALLLGYYDDQGRLVYAGHTGGGFTRASLEDTYRRLAPLERKTSPFATPPRTNEKAHWVRPQVVVEVKFNEWTADGRLRQPIFLGIRDDKDPREVTREPTSLGAA
jgi:bifunctional non-homologous end joining protein LigD